MYLRLSCKILIRLSAVTRLDPAVRTSFVDARRHSTVSFNETFLNVHGISASSPSLTTNLWYPVWVWFQRIYIIGIRCGYFGVYLSILYVYVACQCVCLFVWMKCDEHTHCSQCKSARCVYGKGMQGRKKKGMLVDVDAGNEIYKLGKITRMLARKQQVTAAACWRNVWKMDGIFTIS